MEHYTSPPYTFVACVEEIYIYLIFKILIVIQIPISREIHAAVINYVYVNELQQGRQCGGAFTSPLLS
jgi:hypothetical protein